MASAIVAFARRRMRSAAFRIRVLRLLPLAGPLALVLFLATLLIQALIPLGLSLATGNLVGRLPAAISRATAEGSRELLLALGLLGSLFVAARIVGPVSSVTRAYASRRIDAAVQARVMHAASAPVGIGHLENPAVMDELSHADEPVGEVVLSVPALISASIEAIGAVLIVGRVDWRIGAVLLGLVVAQRTFWRDFFLRMSDVRSAMTRDLRRAAYLADLVLQPSAAKETRIFDLSKWIAKQYAFSWARAVEPMWKLDDENLRGLLKFLPIRAASYAIPYLALVLQVTSGQISLAAFTAAIQATSIAVVSARFRAEDVYLEQMAAPVHALYKVEAIPVGRAVGASAVAPRSVLEFSDVKFNYPGSPIQVYEGLTLRIPAGISTAIVGPNGAGKTTLVKLLARLYEPTSGRILVDGIDLVDVDATSWRTNLAIILQDFTRYQLTASDNVAFGSPGLTPLEAHREAAAIKSGADQVISSLDLGWDTILSRQFEGGTDLSGGQWQRIALARALYAVEGGASVLVLDEPTANLDVRAEAALFDDFMDITKGLTTILISHRFSTVRRAQHICVIDHGRLIEEGTHDELIELAGTYARMFEIQAERFR